MPDSRFLLTGTPDLALTVAAARLDEAGLTCNLETAFAGGFEASGWEEGQAGDASWRKAAHLHLCEPGTVVLHAIRDPRAAIPELAAGPWVDEARREGRAVAGSLPAVMTFPTPTERAMALWFGWHSQIELASKNPGLRYARFLVEAMDTRLIGEIGAFLGRPTQVVDAQPDFKVEEDHTCMPAGPLLDEVLGLAAHFGYPVAVENPAA